MDFFFFWLPSLPQDPNTSLLQFVCWFFAIQSAGQSPLAGEVATGERIRKVGYPGLRIHLNGRSSWFRWALPTRCKCSPVAEGHREGDEDRMAMSSMRSLGCGAECGMRANLLSTESAVSCQYGRDESYGTSDCCRRGGERRGGRCSLEFLSQLSWFLTLLLAITT